MSRTASVLFFFSSDRALVALARMNRLPGRQVDQSADHYLFPITPHSVLKFYTDIEKQLEDVHQEARRIAVSPFLTVFFACSISLHSVPLRFVQFGAYLQARTSRKKRNIFRFLELKLMPLPPPFFSFFLTGPEEGVLRLGFSIWNTRRACFHHVCVCFYHRP